MKLIFAKRMMENARAKGLIPAEQFAKAGTRCQDGCLIKGFHCDRARILHHSAGISGVDFHSCYDSVQHPLMSVALQAWGVSLMMIKVMLPVLQTMRFFLRTGYGDSEHSYGGTPDDPLGGLGQGNGAAPPAFTAVSTLLILAYVNMGYGVEWESAVSGALFTIAAILYVDDTDLLHWAKHAGMSDEAFFQQVQAATTAWGNLALASGGIHSSPRNAYGILLRSRSGMASRITSPNLNSPKPPSPSQCEMAPTRPSLYSKATNPPKLWESSNAHKDFLMHIFKK
jgi:hypothetical protein